MMNVLWLASWYPCRRDEFNGDFTERQARAVSPFVNLTVLYVGKDAGLKAGNWEWEKNEESGLTVYRAYYGKTRWGGWLEKLLSFRRFIQVQKKMLGIIETEKGIPDCVHVQVAMKAGLLARWLKKKAGIPYIVTEHWTGYYHESIPNVYGLNPYYRQMVKKILRGAAMFLPVSVNLGQTINNNFVRLNFTAVPNVVDTGLFFPLPLSQARFRFIHASYLNYQKNPEGIIRAFAELIRKGYKAELIFLGRTDESLLQWVAGLGLLDSSIVFKGEVEYSDVAREMQRSSALVLFSRFENLPCVILEALCCGLPVISSRVGGIPEVLNESNGLLVENGNIDELTGAMIQIMEKYSSYDREKIAIEAAGKYHYDTIGKQILSVYQTIAGAHSGY